ncbi:hypothetical protein J2Y38_002747 [Flavobacterium sp. 2755]|uniref:glycosyltransferase n=1 Tax=Flavobacterium sp. 2755 TaxID=2817765 RepID=UPI00285A7FB0|nr:glycosyltransferase [Flavobacterium sp. 2755]MDR6762536.1 hypothetical protein [Flavobacterium sp. 2755]
MRVGYNPNKDKVQEDNVFFHQVVIPVYIPNQEGYFKDSFKILQYCLESLFKTCHNKTYFTIVNNGSNNEVVEYLNNLYHDKKIHELIHTSNIGKINAVLKGITGQNFKLITIADADALFLNEWQNATYEVFKAFPKAGAVCPTPSPKSFSNKTANVIFENLFSNLLKFTAVKNPKALQYFANSIGNPEFYKNTHLEKYLTLSNGNLKAVIGAGHFVATYRSDVFSNLGVLFSDYSLGGNSEDEILDKTVVRNGLWRLSTEDNFVYHMGNVEEEWMLQKLEKTIISSDNIIEEVQFDKQKEKKIISWIKNDLFYRFIFQKNIKKKFLIYKGLTKEEAKNY